MLEITEHIEYLLMRHDCVVVSGLGAFLIYETPACYDSNAQRFNPPCRSLGFNPELRHNDGLLVASIARREGISAESAKNEIEIQVATLRHQMDLNGEVQIGGLGVLHRGATIDAPIFEPSASSMATMRYAGLKPIGIKPLVKPGNEPADEIDDSPRIITIPAPLKIVASIVVIMVALGILYSTSLVRSPETNLASLDTGISTKIEASMPFETVVDSSFGPALSREIQLNISLPIAPEEAPVVMVSESESSSEGNHFSDSDRYLLVVASYPSHSLAMKHINGNPDMRVIEMDGNYRVYVATCRTIGEARAEIETMSATYPNVWVCKR